LKACIAQYKEDDVIDQNPIKTDVRRRKRQDRFDCATPRCLFCGYPDIEALTGVTLEWLNSHGSCAPKSLTELHHVVGKKRDADLVVPLCLNCHRGVTEGLAKAGISMHAERESKTLVASMLDALASFLEFLVSALRQWAELLRANDARKAAIL
jgi:hypothetical protein